MGDLRQNGWGRGHDGKPEHPVALHSFFLDRFEMTVGRYRDARKHGFKGLALARGANDWNSKNPQFPFTGQDCNAQPVGETIDPKRDALPLNCVDFKTARSLCTFLGKRLPTEAEWEWAAGGRENEWLFPWGDTNDSYCPQSIDASVCARSVPLQCENACLGITHPDGEKFGLPVGTRPHDVTFDGVADMALNVSEWVLDDFQAYDDTCWLPGAYDVDPTCTNAPGVRGFGKSIRGGGYHTEAYGAEVSFRQAYPAAFLHWSHGFRCARDDLTP